MPASFCIECGAVVTGFKFCSACGTKVYVGQEESQLAEAKVYKAGVAEAVAEEVKGREGAEEKGGARPPPAALEAKKYEGATAAPAAEEYDSELARALEVSRRMEESRWEGGEEKGVSPMDFFAESKAGGGRDEDFELAMKLSLEEAKGGGSYYCKEERAIPTPAASPLDVPATINYTRSHSDPASVAVPTTIRDARPLTASNTLTLETHGFTLVPHETSLKTADFYDSSENGKFMREQVYYSEISSLIESVTGADKVFVLADQVRNNSKKDGTKLNAFAGGQVAGYAGVVHSDYCGANAVKKFYRANGIPDGIKVRYMLINTWRNISDSAHIHNNTLACVDTTSVDNADFVRFDEPLKPGAACRSSKNGASLGDCAEQYRLTPDHLEDHRWYYYPHMKKDEVLFFVQFDSDPSRSSRFCFHTAFADPRVPASAPTRESMEVRAMCIFIEDDPNWGVLNSSLIKHQLVDNIALAADSKMTLQERLAAGAEKGHISKNEVEAIAEHAALERLDSNALIKNICEERGIEYNETDWLLGQATAPAETLRSRVGAYDVMHRHWDGGRALTSGLHTHSSGVVLSSDGTFTSGVSLFRDEKSRGRWETRKGKLTLIWNGEGGLETRFLKLKGKMKFRGTHFRNGAEIVETEGALVLEMRE
jgi:hypothetical protein